MSEPNAISTSDSGVGVGPTSDPVTSDPTPEQTRAYVGRDIVLVRRVLSRLTIRNTVDGIGTLEDAATPKSRIDLRGDRRTHIGDIDAAELDAIIREESIRARDLASKNQVR